MQSAVKNNTHAKLLDPLETFAFIVPARMLGSYTQIVQGKHLKMLASLPTKEASMIHILVARWDWIQPNILLESFIFSAEFKGEVAHKQS